MAVTCENVCALVQQRLGIDSPGENHLATIAALGKVELVRADHVISFRERLLLVLSIEDAMKWISEHPEAKDVSIKLSGEPGKFQAQVFCSSFAFRYYDRETMSIRLWGPAHPDRDMLMRLPYKDLRRLFAVEIENLDPQSEGVES